MIFLLSMYAVFFSGSAFAALFFRKRFEWTVAPFVMLSGLILFGLGWFGRLAWGVPALWLLSIGLWAASLWHVFHYRSGKRFCACFITPGFVFFVVASIFFYHSTRGLQFRGIVIDTYGHWARVIWNMHQADALLPTATARMFHGGYPPGLALWQYAAIRIFGAYQEGIILFANEWFSLSLAIVVFSRANWRRRDLPLFLAAGLSAVSLKLVFFPIPDMLVDRYLGMLFGFACCVAFLLRQEKVFRFVLLMMALPFLFLMKPAGLGLAFLIGAYLFLNSARIAMAGWRQKGKWRTGLQDVGASALLLLGVGLVQFAWQHELDVHAVPERFAAPAWQEIKAACNGTDAEFTRLAGLFVKKCGTPVYEFGFMTMSYGLCVGLFAVLAAWLYVGFMCRTPAGRTFLRLSGFLLAGSVLYAVTLLFYYAYSSFNADERSSFSGFGRYTALYTLALFFVLQVCLLRIKRRTILSHMFVWAVLLMPVLAGAPDHFKTWKRLWWHARGEVGLGK